MSFGNPYAPTVNQVALPFSNPIPGGLTYGKQIQIQGIVQNVPGSDGFGINLSQGPNISPNTALHFNPRFKESCIVRNSMLGGKWGAEERNGGLPIIKGKLFEIIIMTSPTSFLIAVNGIHFAEFKHRFPVEKISYLLIDGVYIQINFVKYEGGETTSAPAVMGDMKGFGLPQAGLGFYPSPPPYTPGGFAEPAAVKSGPFSGENIVYNPPVPLILSVPGGMVPNRIIYMSAVPLPDAKRFTVNLKQGQGSNSNIAFHFDVRMVLGSDRNVIVRNTCTGGNWGLEERAINHFPFMPNAPFDIIILAERDKFKVAVNNTHFLDYKHRLPLQSVTTFNVTGDLRITTVRFQ